MNESHDDCRDEKSHGDVDSTGAVAAVTLALAVCHLHLFGTGTLNTSVQAADAGTVTYGTGLSLNVLHLLPAHGSIDEFWVVVLLPVRVTVLEESIIS